MTLIFFRLVHGIVRVCFLSFLPSVRLSLWSVPSFLPSLRLFVRSFVAATTVVVACCWLTSVVRTLFFRVIDCAPRAHTPCRLSLCGWPAARHPLRHFRHSKLGRNEHSQSLSHTTQCQITKAIDRSIDRADCVCSFALSTTAITNLTALLSLSWPCFGGIAGTSPHLPQRTSSCRSFVCHDFCCTSRDRD